MGSRCSKRKSSSVQTMTKSLSSAVDTSLNSTRLEIAENSGNDQDPSTVLVTSAASTPSDGMDTGSSHFESDNVLLASILKCMRTYYADSRAPLVRNCFSGMTMAYFFAQLAPGCFHCVVVFFALICDHLFISLISFLERYPKTQQLFWDSVDAAVQDMDDCETRWNQTKRVLCQWQRLMPRISEAMKSERPLERGFIEVNV